jgi:hypothetical protein
MRTSTANRITASIFMLLFVLGMVAPHFVMGKVLQASVVKVAKAGDQDGPQGHRDHGLPFDEKDSSPERELTDADERVDEKEVEGLRIAIARTGEFWLQRVVLARLRDLGDGMQGDGLGLPRYLVLHALLI